MKDYLTTVFMVSALSGILESLTHHSVKNSTRALIGIVSLFLLLSPVKSLFDGSVDLKPTVSFPNGDFSEQYSDYVKQAFESGIKMAIATDFQLNSDEIRVKARGFDSKNMRAEEIAVTLFGASALADHRAVREYINKMKIGECRVEVQIG